MKADDKFRSIGKMDIINDHWRTGGRKSVGRAMVLEVNSDGAARCYVFGGVVSRSALVQVFRNGSTIYPHRSKTAALSALRKPLSEIDADKFGKGSECVLKVGGFEEFHVGDVLDCCQLDDIALRYGL